MKLVTEGFLGSLIKYANLKFLNQNGGSNMANHNVRSRLIRMELGTRGVFGVADYESKLKIYKFKMSDPIWRTKMQKVGLFRWNSVLGGFWGRWLRI